MAAVRGMQMKAVKELRGSFPELLRSRRGGVIAATLAASARTGAGQVDLCKALSAALRELPGNTQVCQLNADLSSIATPSVALGRSFSSWHRTVSMYRAC